eukprot:scaffold16102_cov157-Isochrysis_galbana.AAC.2
MWGHRQWEPVQGQEIGDHSSNQLGRPLPLSTRPSHPPQPRTPEIIGHAPGGKVKGGGERGGDASLPEDSRNKPPRQGCVPDT